MTCCTLELIDDAFGVPIDESFINRIHSGESGGA